jgi:predicted pyridoxine 5'-phosphate oxidase superfamily flavin-nucleotide-binding protein
VTNDLASILAATRSFYFATANADGQPYIQHRGGPEGFLHMLDERTLAFADFAGNRQYITTGNLADNPKAHIFIMDYARQRRVKLWGRARTVQDDPDLVARLFPKGYDARPIQAIVFNLEAWDLDCPSHIPQMFHADDVAETILRFQRRIDDLEATIARLAQPVPAPPG